MKAVYLSTNGDSTTVLPYPLEVQGYVCGVLKLNRRITIPRNHDNTNKKDPNNENLYLCYKIVEESFGGNLKIPVL